MTSKDREKGKKKQVMMSSEKKRGREGEREREREIDKGRIHLSFVCSCPQVQERMFGIVCVVALCGGFMCWLYYFTNDEESDSNGFVLTTQQYIFLLKFLGGKKGVDYCHHSILIIHIYLKINLHLPQINLIAHPNLIINSQYLSDIRPRQPISLKICFIDS